jgi:hypothetical protein
MENKGSEVNTKRNKRWLELVATILLSAATMLSAWCVYESSQWNGEQYFRIEDENMADRKRLQKEIASHQRLSADAQIFLQYVNAITNNNKEFAKFLIDRFPSHLKKAAIAWKALDPLNNPDAPVSPMQMKEYVLPEEADIAKYAEQAKEFKIAANKCDNHSDNYMFVSLILSTVLFFCGLSGVLDSWSNRLILIIFASIIFFIALYFVIRFPVII